MTTTDSKPIYDRVTKAFPHLETLANDAREGSREARIALAENVLEELAPEPLAVHDLCLIAGYIPHKDEYVGPDGLRYSHP